MILEKINRCRNNPENSSTTKLSEHIPSGISLSTVSLFGSIENKHDVYRSKEDTMKTINSKRKKNEIINKRAAGTMEMQKSVIFVKKNLKINI